MKAALSCLLLACAGMTYAETAPAQLTSPAGPLPDDLAAQIGPVIAACWMPESPDLPVVTLNIRLTRESNISDVSLQSASSDTQMRVQRAYEAARRAVLRCGGHLELPVEQYDVWRDIEMTFDPTPEAGP
jgi:hypothetical protein